MYCAMASDSDTVVPLCLPSVISYHEDTSKSTVDSLCNSIQYHRAYRQCVCAGGALVLALRD